MIDSTEIVIEKHQREVRDIVLDVSPVCQWNLLTLLSALLRQELSISPLMGDMTIPVTVEATVPWILPVLALSS